MRLARGETLARYLDGLPVTESDTSKIEKKSFSGDARECFYNSLPESDMDIWKHHETDRSALIASSLYGNRKFELYAMYKG